MGRSMKYLFSKKTGLLAKVQASTLLETIVASVIFMIIFVMAMDTMTRIAVSNQKDGEYLLIESSFNKCTREIKNKELAVGANTYTFKWGRIDVTVSPYTEKLFLVEMNAVTDRKREVSYRYIVADETNNE